jgi:hypothetical protein
MHRDEVNAHLILAIYGDSDPVRALNSGEAMASDDEDPRSPVQKIVEAARLAVAMGKSTENLEWEEEIGTPAPAKPFAKSSEERFAKTCAALKKIFGEGHEDEYEEAVELARTIRAEAVAEIVARF